MITGAASLPRPTMPNPAPGASQPTPHRTPLRRVSQGSLFALSRSGQYPDAPHGLGFLEPAMSELADEAEALHANVEGLKRLSDSLATFNESFASWLYVMKMNALTTDWPQVSKTGPFLNAGPNERRGRCLTFIRQPGAYRRVV